MTLTIGAGDLSAESDAQLAARFVREAMPFHTVLLRTARRLTHSQADAEDLVQDTLMNAYTGFRRFEPGTNLRAWLFTILRNTYFSECRRRCAPRSPPSPSPARTRAASPRPEAR